MERQVEERGTEGGGEVGQEGSKQTLHGESEGHSGNVSV